MSKDGDKGFANDGEEDDVDGDKVSESEEDDLKETYQKGGRLGTLLGAEDSDEDDGEEVSESEEDDLKETYQKGRRKGKGKFVEDYDEDDEDDWESKMIEDYEEDFNKTVYAEVEDSGGSEKKDFGSDEDWKPDSYNKIHDKEFENCRNMEEVIGALINGNLDEDSLKAAESKLKEINSDESIYDRVIAGTDGGKIIFKAAREGTSEEVRDRIIAKTTGNRENDNKETPLHLILKNKWVNNANLQLPSIFKYMKDSYPECFITLTEKPNITALHTFGLFTFPQFDLDKDIFQLVACIDVAGFKSINDIFNHSGGDTMLKKYASRMQKRVDKINKYYKIPFQGDPGNLTFQDDVGMVIAQLYHRSGDEFFILFQFQSESAKMPIYSWCKENIGTMHIPMQHSEEDPTGVFTFLRLGCLWGRKSSTDNKFVGFHDEAYKTRRKAFENDYIKKSDQLEIELKDKIDQGFGIERGKPITKVQLDSVLKGENNVSDLFNLNKNENENEKD